MVDLNQFKKTSTLEAIKEKGITVEYPRDYLGMSELGHFCPRYLWYSFRWCFKKTTTARMNRLLNRGKREEPEIIKALNTVGIEVYGDQLECIAVSGHCKGHNDGFAKGVIEAPSIEHLAEFKTMADKYFKEIKKSNLKVARFEYYAQIQLYMHFFECKRGLFLAVNKNDDDYYIEIIYPEKGIVEDLIRRAEDVIMTDIIPSKDYKSNWYQCRYCNAMNTCHYNMPIEKNCRTCSYGDIIPDGKWSCSHYDIPLPTEAIVVSHECGKYDLLECLSSV